MHLRCEKIIRSTENHISRMLRKKFRLETRIPKTLLLSCFVYGIIKQNLINGVIIKMEKLSTDKRRDEIVLELQRYGKVRVTELSKRFGISEVSIRKDLDSLAAAGQLSRVHGGAIASDSPYANLNLNERYNTNTELKLALAERVADLVEDNDTVLMNAGTTLTYVLRALRKKKNISIVTNSIQNANEINRFPTFNVILLGGEIDSRYQFTFGSDTIRQLENYHANKCILSVDGISSSTGLSLYYSNEVEIIRTMMRSSDTVIVAADSTKLGKNSFSRIGTAKDVDILVTNRSDNTTEVSALRDLGITIIEAE